MCVCVCVAPATGASLIVSHPAFLQRTMSSDAGDLSQDDPNLSRSERKRNREQHRRNEVTNGLDALASMLSTVDPARMKGGRWTSKKETGDGGVAMSRVELLNHALETLERLHKENEARKDIIAELSKGKALSKGAALNDLISQQLKKQRTEVRCFNECVNLAGTHHHIGGRT